MRKIILSLCLAVCLAVWGLGWYPVQAQTATSTDQLRQQLVLVLRQLLEQLTRRLNEILSTSGGLGTIPSSGAEFPPLVDKFMLGQSGPAVIQLQKMLARDGVYSGPVTGYYGTLTEAAVGSFQVKYRIATTPLTFGLAGPLTRAKLNDLYAHTQSVSSEDSSSRSASSTAASRAAVSGGGGGNPDHSNNQQNPSGGGGASQDQENGGNESQTVKPGPTNTGPVNQNILIPSGSITIIQDGTTLENLDVTGSVTIKANNVTIRNFRINATGKSYGLKSFGEFNGALLEDGEIYGSSGALLVGNGITARRLNLHDGGSDGINPYSSLVLENSWIHHLGTSVGSHADGIQFTGGSHFEVRNNNFDMPINLTGYRSNATMFINQVSDTPVTDVLIEGNWLNGGNYTIYCLKQSDTRIINNRFGRGFRYNLYSDSSVAEPCLTTGNVWDDTGDPVLTQAAATTYSITASAQANGTINPSGIVSVTSGQDKIFQVTADQGYEIDSLIIDGVSAAAANAYTFSGVQADHSIVAIFKTSSQSSDPPPPSSVVIDDPVLRFSFDGSTITSANILEDQTSNNNDGTLVGGPLTSPGRMGEALQLDGVDDLVSTAFLPPVANHARTFSFWFNSINASAPGTILSYGHTSSGNGFTVRLPSLAGAPTLELFTNGAARAINASLESGRWYHAAVVVPEGVANLSQVKFYLNGAEQAGVMTLGSTQGINTSSASKLSLGRNNYGTKYFFNGQLDDFRAYDRSLSATEVEALYLEGSEARQTSFPNLASIFQALLRLAVQLSTLQNR